MACHPGASRKWGHCVKNGMEPCPVQVESYFTVFWIDVKEIKLDYIMGIQ